MNSAKARRAGAALLSALLAATWSIAAAAPAMAAGDPSVDHYIITNPEPGWALDTGPGTEAIASTLQTDARLIFNQDATVAAEAWSTTGPPGEMLIVLMRFPGGAPANWTTGLRTVVSQACLATTSQPASIILPVPAIPQSEEGLCSGSADDGAAPVTDVAWVQANVVGLISGAGLPSLSVEQTAQAQSANIPLTGIPESSFPILLVVGGGVAIVVLAVAIILLVRRSKKSASPVGSLGSPASAYSRGFYDVHGYAGTGAPPGGTYSAEAGGDTSGSIRAGDGHYVPYSAHPRGRAQSEMPYGSSSHGSAAAPGPPLVSYPPPPGTAPDWYPVEGDPYRQAYWDGSRWLSQKRWDGSAWVDEA
jgi:hypothetical protein